MSAPDFEPVVVVTRHPDFADEITLHYLEARVVYLDLGSSFNVTPDDAEDAREWADAVWRDVSDLPADHAARAEVLGVIATTVERYFRVTLAGDELALEPVEEDA